VRSIYPADNEKLTAASLQSYTLLLRLSLSVADGSANAVHPRSVTDETWLLYNACSSGVKMAAEKRKKPRHQKTE
jgi:hypothetical protein